MLHCRLGRALLSGDERLCTNSAPPFNAEAAPLNHPWQRVLVWSPFFSTPPATERLTNHNTR